METNEWTDGVLSSVMRTISADEKPDQKWIVFDGPVDADWIESTRSFTTPPPFCAVGQKVDFVYLIATMPGRHRR